MYERFAERAKLRYLYNEETGELRRKNSSKIIRTSTSIDYQVFRPYQVIFLLKEGYVPETIDHKNGNTTDNRWTNLRAATRKQQSANTTKVGVYQWPSGLYYYQLQVDGKRYYQTGFATREAATAAHKEKCLELQGEFAVQLRDE